MKIDSQIATIHIVCPNCGRNTMGSQETQCTCGRSLPQAFIIPYEAQWDYNDDHVTLLKGHRSLRLMGRFSGKAPEQLVLLNHAEYLYLSRYPKFSFDFLSSFQELEVLELDLIEMGTLEGIGQLPALRSLSLMECRKLNDVGGLSGLAQLAVLSIGLCNKIQNLDPVSDCGSLMWFRFEGKELNNIQFLSNKTKLRTAILNCKVQSAEMSPIIGSGIERLFIKKKAFAKSEIDRFRVGTPNCEIKFI